MTPLMKTKSLQKQLIVSLCLSLALLCVLGNMAVFTYIKALDLEEFDEELVTDMQTVSMLVTSNAQGWTVQADFNLHSVEYFQISSADGKVLFRSPSLKGFVLPFLNMRLGQTHIQDCPLPNGQRGRMAVLSFFPQFRGDKTPGSSGNDYQEEPIQLAFAKSREGLDRILNLEFWFSLLIGGILILSAAFVVFISVNRSFRRLGDFVQQVKAINPKAISQRLRGDHLPTELIPLRDEFNSLLNKLEATFNREKRFNANVAHELRTPIAELRLLHEVALQEIERGDASPLSRMYVDDALQLIARMERIIEVLTLLNRFEAKEIQAMTEPVDVAALIQSSWNAHEQEAEEKHIVGSFTMTQPALLNSDPTILSAIVENLISNAITYSPTSSTITCHLHIKGSALYLELINTCLDLSSEDLDFLSEPFWQKDTSRTSTKHIGLGLTLVKMYCKVLNIKLDFWLEDNSAFHVLLVIPTQTQVNNYQSDQSLHHVSPSTKRHWERLLMILMPIVLFFQGCAGPSPDYSGTVDRIEAQTGYRSGMKATPNETVIPENVSLQDGITVEEAITVALWNNAAFQEALSGLGLAQADVVQANMLQNPEFWGIFPMDPNRHLEYALRFPLESLWLRPQRVASAQRKLEQAIEGLIQNGSSLVRDVKVAFANVLLAEQRLSLTGKQVEILRQIAQINDSRWQAGEISDLDAGTSRIDELQAEEQIHQLTHDLALMREQFRVLIGLGFEDSAIVLQSPSTLPTTPRSADEFLTDALTSRPDLRAAKLEVEAAGIRAGLAHKEIFYLIGIYRADQTSTSPYNNRPGLRFNVPIFDQNQGGIAQAEARFAMAARRYVTVRDQISLEVNQAHTRWLQTKTSVQNWQERMLPAHRTATHQAHKALDAGDVTPLIPLAAQRKWVQAQIREVELIADHRRALAELERAIGHSLDLPHFPKIESPAS